MVLLLKSNFNLKYIKGQHSMKRIVVVLCALSFNSLWAMEQARITVNPMNGNLVVPRHIIEQCSRLTSDRDFQFQHAQDNPLKKLESMELDIDLVGQDKRALQLALQCVSSPLYSLSHIASADLVAVFEAADFIGVPLHILQSLAQRITSELDATTLPQEIYIRIQEVISMLPRTSVSTIALQDIYNNETGTIHLANRDIDTIDDIDVLLSNNTIDSLRVRAIDISNNNLTKLPIKRLVTYFSQLCYIKASHNKLTELTAEDFACLPDATVLDVCNNTIQIFKADPNIFMRGTRCNIYLNNNCLSIEDIRRIQSFVNTAPLWRKIETNKPSFRPILIMLGGISGAFCNVFMLNLPCVKEFLLRKNNDIIKFLIYLLSPMSLSLFMGHILIKMASNNNRNSWQGNTLIADPKLQYIKPALAQLQHLKAYASRINKRGLALQ